MKLTFSMIEMRNYLFSIAVHVFLFLLLLGLSFTTVNKEPLDVQQAIIVDFTHSEEPRAHVQKTKESEEKPSKPRDKDPSPPKDPVAKVSKATKVKTFEKKTLQSSQKPKAESSKVLEEKSSVVKKVIPSADTKPTPEEIAEQKRAKKKKETFSQFKALLSKAKNPGNAEEAKEANEPNSNTAEDGKAKSKNTNKNIQGVLGNRKVLRTPSIVDKSQKKGRVVVKICVNDQGKVISSKYTMMGSTTSDTYLIGLAEKGAKEYLFSASSNTRECGNVVIDFQLK